MRKTKSPSMSSSSTTTCLPSNYAIAAELRIRAGEERITEARNSVQAGTALDVAVQEGTAEIAEARLVLGGLEDTEADLRADLNDLIGLPIETEIALSTPVVDIDRLDDFSRLVADTSAVLQEGRNGWRSSNS